MSRSTFSLKLTFQNFAIRHTCAVGTLLQCRIALLRCRIPLLRCRIAHLRCRIATRETTAHMCRIPQYEVASISRLSENTGLFRKRALSKRLHSAKETYIWKGPTNHSHPIPSFESTISQYGTRERRLRT